jgi:hypothetical protein
MTSADPIDDIGDECLPIEVAKDRGGSLLIAEMTENLMNVIDQDVPRSLLSAMYRNLDIRDAETEAAGGTVLVRETACRM